MQLKLDTVRGHTLSSGIYQGRLVRTGVIFDMPIPVGSIPDPTMLIQALGTSGMPQKGDVYPHPDYDQWFCKTHNLTAVDAYTAVVQIVYEYLGLLTMSDRSSLSMDSTQLDPKTNKPIYVTYTPPSGTAIKKLANARIGLPIRHFTVSQTIDHTASSDVIDIFPSVNDRTWQGKPAGYWLYSAIDGDTQDDGITYTYDAVFSTRNKWDWSEIEFMTDDAGQAIFVPEASVATLRASAYAYGLDNSVNGVTKIGPYPVADFFSIFGV